MEWTLALWYTLAAQDWRSNSSDGSGFDWRRNKGHANGAPRSTVQYAQVLSKTRR